MIREYAIIREENMFLLTDAINRSIKEGWQPIGGVSVNYGHYDNYEPDKDAKADVHFYQSIVR